MDKPRHLPAADAEQARDFRAPESGSERGSRWWLPGIGRRRNTSASTVYIPTHSYPETVKFGLQHAKALLNAREVGTLFQSGFADIGFYLAMKSAVEDDDVQRALLERVAERGFDPSRMTVEDARVALDAMRARERDSASRHTQAMDIRRESGVQAGKLGEVSRHGFTNWSDTFRPLLAGVFEENPLAEVFIVPNAPYISLGVFAEQTLHQGRPLSVLRLERVDQLDRPVGWRMEPSGGEVTILALPHGFERPEGGVIIDDTIKSGNNKDLAIGFWNRERTNHPPKYLSVRRIDPHASFI